MWWRRKIPSPPRVRFDGTLPRKGPFLIRLPTHPALASVALDAVSSLREAINGQCIVLAPPTLFPLVHAHMEGLTLLSGEMEKPDREDLFGGISFTSFWDLDEEPPAPAWLRAIYPHLSGPHFSFHEEGTFVFRIRLPCPDRWKVALTMVGLPWKPLHTPADPSEEKSVVDFLKGRFGWKGDPIVVVEDGPDPPPPWFSLRLDRPDIASWSVARIRALLALARVYVGAGRLVGEALRLGLVTILTTPLPIRGTLTLSEETWTALRNELPS